MSLMRQLLIYIICLSSFGTSFAATKKTADPEEVLAKAREAFANYNPVEARELYDEYISIFTKKKKTPDVDIEGELSRLVLMENMLSRVENITVVDSMIVDADGFFKHYRLSPESGRILPGEILRMKDVELAFVPQNNTEFFYADSDSAGYFRLMKGDILDDGTVEKPMPLEGEYSYPESNSEYPFMLTDGMTLYFANDSEESLGGYDIFLTRRDDDGSFLQSQNIGMPYNSPYDDYLMAIDEVTGIGWWATDRNLIPGKLTIYMFEVPETRTNVDSDNEHLVSLARLDSIELTQKGKDITAAKARLKDLDTKVNRDSKNPTNAFRLVVGNTGRVYEKISDFRSPQARKSMALALDAKMEAARTEERLAELRKQWRQGNKSVEVTIINLEQTLADARRRKQNLTNQAISQEVEYIK